MLYESVNASLPTGAYKLHTEAHKHTQADGRANTLTVELIIYLAEVIQKKQKIKLMVTNIKNSVVRMDSTLYNGVF